MSSLKLKTTIDVDDGKELKINIFDMDAGTITGYVINEEYFIPASKLTILEEKITTLEEKIAELEKKQENETNKKENQKKKLEEIIKKDPHPHIQPSSILRLEEGMTQEEKSSLYPATKNCSKCGKEKPVSAFTPSDKYKSGYLSQCKECMSAYQRQHYKDNIKKYARDDTEEKKEVTIVSLDEKHAVEGKAPDRTALFLTWIKGKTRFDLRDFVNQNRDKVTDDDANKIIYHQVNKHRLLQVSATEFKVV